MRNKLNEDTTCFCITRISLTSINTSPRKGKETRTLLLPNFIQWGGIKLKRSYIFYTFSHNHQDNLRYDQFS